MTFRDPLQMDLAFYEFDGGLLRRLHYVPGDPPRWETGDDGYARAASEHRACTEILTQAGIPGTLTEAVAALLSDRKRFAEAILNFAAHTHGCAAESNGECNCGLGPVLDLVT